MNSAFVSNIMQVVYGITISDKDDSHAMDSRRDS